MFGYVIADFNKLSKEDAARYRACYCGLCHAMCKKYGIATRFILNYDITFLAVVLSSIYGEGQHEKKSVCIMHPLRKEQYFQSEIFEYAAAMNVALVYYKLSDDWEDDRKPMALSAMRTLRKPMSLVREEYSDKCSIIVKMLSELGKTEKRNETNPDIPADIFGRLLGEVFAIYDDEHKNRLYNMGYTLGKFIYIVDACIDLKDDLKKKRYNPLISTFNADRGDILNILMADCIDAYKELNLSTNNEIVENILYSGVWTKYEQHNKRNRKQK